MRFSSVVTHIVLVIFTLTFAAVTVTAVAPTEEAIKKWKAEVVWEQVVANWKAFKKSGGCCLCRLNFRTVVQILLEFGEHGIYDGQPGV